MSIRCLGLSGSLRTHSSNSTLIEAAIRLAPDGMTVVRFDRIDSLPHFNADRDWTRIPEVVDWADRVREADGIIVSSPEYARGIPGALKNAFDWLVGTDAFVAKPFMLLSASARALHAPAALRLVLQTMSGVCVDDACVTVDLLGRDLDVETLLARPDDAARIHSAIVAFGAAIVAAPD